MNAIQKLTNAFDQLNVVYTKRTVNAEVDKENVPVVEISIVKDENENAVLVFSADLQTPKHLFTRFEQKKVASKK